MKRMVLLMVFNFCSLVLATPIEEDKGSFNDTKEQWEKTFQVKHIFDPSKVAKSSLSKRYNFQQGVKNDLKRLISLLHKLESQENYRDKMIPFRDLFNAANSEDRSSQIATLNTSLKYLRNAGIIQILKPVKDIRGQITSYAPNRDKIFCLLDVGDEVIKIMQELQFIEISDDQICVKKMSGMPYCGLRRGVSYEESQKNLNMEKKCFQCEENLNDNEESADDGNHLYHVKCLVCEVCHRPISGIKVFRYHNEKKYCELHYPDKKRI